MHNGIDANLALLSATVTLGTLIAAQALKTPDNIALKNSRLSYTYREFENRTSQLANYLTKKGIIRGDRIAILAENSIEYVELLVAGSKIGAIVACQNWRLTQSELTHCISLVDPKIIFASQRYANTAKELNLKTRLCVFNKSLTLEIQSCSKAPPTEICTPEDGVVILYTSGTTGLPKGALISHRAEIARAQIQMLDLPASPNDVFVAWAPLFHMVSTDTVFKTLMIGGTVMVTDGFDAQELAQIIETEKLGRLTLMPGMITPIIDAVRNNGSKVKGIKWIGAMADLVPLEQIADVTSLLNAPYLNTFGATETGFAPATAGVIKIGEKAKTLDKMQSSLCQIKLVDKDDNEVQEGEPGELAIRSPALFSGYWNDAETNQKDFRGGWFYMGDVFRRNSDGTLSFLDRRKYLIKSGGENIYPTEIERIILTDARVIDVAIVRKIDPRWGEVPVAFIARKDESLTENAVLSILKNKLARYKYPKEIRFLPEKELPRSATGKIMRHILEKKLN